MNHPSAAATAAVRGRVKSNSRPPWNSRFWTTESARSKSLDYHQSFRSGRHFPRPKSERTGSFIIGAKSQPNLFNQLGDGGRPSSILDHQHQEFLQSLRNFQQDHIKTSPKPQQRRKVTNQGQYFRLSRDLLDSFVRLKSTQFDSAMMMEAAAAPNGGSGVESHGPTNQLLDIDSLSTTNTSTPKKQQQQQQQTSSQARPKSATTTRNVQFGSGPDRSPIHSSINPDHLMGLGDMDPLEENGDRDEQSLFHRSLSKISSIANWEKQLRYEMEIEGELQRRQLERQLEKLESDRRKLDEWDKQLRIELDGRERKLRLNEIEFRSRCEELANKTSEVARRESMLQEIVQDRVKQEMKLEVDKLRKKFNELEVEKNQLEAKEQRVKQVEARLHQQVKIVKEKIDSKRQTDIEMAKHRKELEIVSKENEVLRQKVDSMQDYQLNQFENRALKNELQTLKQTLQLKGAELERERDRAEKEQRASDQTIANLKAQLRKAELEVTTTKQKTAAELDEIGAKYEAANGQCKRMQLFIKQHLAQLNYDFSGSTTGPTAVHLKHGTPGTVGPIHRRHHSIQHNQTGPGARHGQINNGTYHHQRSVSMDGANQTKVGQTVGHWRQYPSSAVTRARGCHLCEDEDEQDLMRQAVYNCGDQLVDEDFNNNQNILLDYEICHQPQDSLVHLEQTHLWSDSSKVKGQLLPHQVPEEPSDLPDEDQVVQKIVNKIYQRMNLDMATTNDEQRSIQQGPHHLASLIEEDSPNPSQIHSEEHRPSSPQQPLAPTRDHQQQHPRSLYEELLTDSVLRSPELNNNTNNRVNPMVSPARVDPDARSSLDRINDDNNNNLQGLNNNNKVEPSTGNGIVSGGSNNDSNSNSRASSIKSSESFEVDW